MRGHSYNQNNFKNKREGYLLRKVSFVQPILVNPKRRSERPPKLDLLCQRLKKQLDFES